MKAFYAMRLAIFIMFFCLAWQPQRGFSAQTIPSDSSAAVILAYHRIGEDAYPDTNLRTEQFEDHIDELINGTYHIMPMPAIVQAFKNNEKLPPQTIAITFEGGYKSILERAVPLLLGKNIPFTIFYAADQAGSHSSQYLNWQDLERLKQNENVTLGILPASYARLSNAPKEETLRQLNKAYTAHQDHFGEAPRFFSYPFGEYNLHYKALIESRNFDAAFGLQSGVAFAGSDLQALPRFTMTENYGDLERFHLVSDALPLPISDIEPDDPSLTAPINAIGFSVSHDLKDDLEDMSCFISGQKDVALEIINDTRVELRTIEPFQEERIRVNCTMPGPLDEDTETPKWRWFGMLLVNPEPDALP